MTTPTRTASTFIEAEGPIRGELFSAERLEQHAESLAAAQVVSVTLEEGNPLIPRVLESGRVLLEYYSATASAIQRDRTMTPAAEWLVDNFYIVEEQLREIRDDLPPSFYRKLPKLQSGHLAGFPRIFGVAWSFIAHTDSRFDGDLLRRFVSAYQRIQPLTIGELWALAITLRVVLVENLRRLAENIVRSRHARETANILVDSLLGIGEQPPASPTILRGYEGQPLERAFAVQMVQRLRDLDPKVGPILLWLDKRLDSQGTTPDEIVRAEHQDQTATTASVRNVITSMQLMSAFDWNEFFEQVSLVDEILRNGSHFAEMDFATRDTYRHAIEDLSRGSSHTEIEIAERSVERAQQTRSRQSNNGRHGVAEPIDPGYYLISKGRRDFERELEYRAPWKKKILRRYVRAALPAYLGSILALTVICLGFPLWYSLHLGIGLPCLIAIGLLASVPASDLAVALVNRAVTGLLGPRTLPRMELRGGVPEQLRTMVVVPTLLTDLASIQEQVERLEIHFLANSEGHLLFALLSDWADCATEKMQGDEELLAAATNGIAKLNERHGPAPDGRRRFYIFHRKRCWNESHGKWMGWERKRGKLHELNKLLRGQRDTSFISQDGHEPDVVPDVRYVITLDADTRLPRDSATRLVGTMAHPLNQPQFSASEGRIVSGYSIVQPRITPTLPPNRDGSIFQRTFSGPSGMDPYAFAVSDVYQDLFAEGTFTGKGIYDIDGFEEALHGKVRDNTLLSHDLLEGIFARAALASDIELFEEFPSHYGASAARQHRWARGDWQLLPWLFTRSISESGQKIRFKIPLISLWKMLDNLRRTLSAPALFLTMVVGWLIPGLPPWLWAAFALFTILIPPLLPFFAGLRPRRKGISARIHLQTILQDLSLAAAQVGLIIAFLSYQTWLMSDAVVRTFGRMFITRRNLLEWVTAAQAKHAADFRRLGIFKQMLSGVVLAIAAIAMIFWRNPHALPLALPFLLLWAVSPEIAYQISQPPALLEAEVLSLPDAQKLRLIGRRTWHYFEAFVTAEDHWLPPDNFQEDPKPVVAHRTSPTNIGLYLLSVIAARDLGWVGTLDAADRLDATLATIGNMEMYRGHLYNWYNTLDLTPLEPKYISSVDGGNLAGHLLVVANACRELIQTPLFKDSNVEGIRDTILLLQEEVASSEKGRQGLTVTRKQFINTVEAIRASSERRPPDAIAWASHLEDLKARAQVVDDFARTLAEEQGTAQVPELLSWAVAVQSCVKSHAQDLEIMVPVSHLRAKPGGGIVNDLRSNVPEWQRVESILRVIPTLANAAEHFDLVLNEISAVCDGLRSDPRKNSRVLGELDNLAKAVALSRKKSADLAEQLNRIASTAESIFWGMDFKFLYEKSRRLFSIGYRVEDGSLDPSCYDLLASEARLTSFIAIAKGDVPSTHWFRLGRFMTPVGRGSALVSWSGSMFEYLMPALVMRSPEGSMLYQTYEQVIRRQIQYGFERGVPWGVSESAFNARDKQLTYQYSSFGVPGLGLKRGLSEDIVISPYSTALAAMIYPNAAMRNFERMAKVGGEGQYGFYEAIDYTSTRVPESAHQAVVHAYMAHHQGMSIVAIADVLEDGIMRSRFHADPIVQASELLLQERTPRDVLAARPRAEEVSAVAQVREITPPVVRRFTTPHDATPRTQLLSNGSYTVMMSAAGSGYSRWRDLAITRWREDATRDCWGAYVYLRDDQLSNVWSAAYQPTCVEADSYDAEFYEDHIEYVRRDFRFNTKTEVVVSSEDDAEVRRVSITNLGTRTRNVQVTSYAEVSLTSQAADAAHPAFSNLFVETEYVPEIGALLATRRKRAADEPSVWAAHLFFVEGETVGDLQYETDRARFLGRGNDLRSPISVMDGRNLSNTTGAVLDPIMSLRSTVRLAPGTTAHLTFTTIVAETREQILSLADKYRDARAFDRTRALSWTHAQVELHHLGIDPDEAHLFQRLANAVIYSDSAFRPTSDQLRQNNVDIATLWSLGISGDLPIVLARIDNEDDIDTIRQLLRAHEYWRMKQFSADLVIINEKLPSYNQDFQGSLEGLVHASQLRLSPDTGNTRGRIFLLRGDLITPQTRAQLQNVARVLILGRRGNLAEQIGRPQPKPVVAGPGTQQTRVTKRPDVKQPDLGLELFNGIGGFDKDGREYVAVLGEGLRTPEPWVNVIANPSFGFLVSESGSSFTWSLNSHENQLTPWSNDHLTDVSGEIFYVRDESTGELWCPTANPIRDETAVYVARHGQGYSSFEHESRGILLNLLQFVPNADPIKVSRLTLQNNSGRSRKLSVTAYAEWVLGSSRSTSAPFVVSEMDPESKAIFARNIMNNEFAGRIAFADLAGKQTSFTADRTDFLGRNGTPRNPAALFSGGSLSKKIGGGLDPCAALQTSIELRPGARAEIVFLLGQTENREQARDLLRQYRAKDINAALFDVTNRWDEILDAVQITTPERTMDLLWNRWLLYQTISSRIWARAGFYQLSGAYGFRDQLQDVMALTATRSNLAREQILRAAGRQFAAGDVQHWWHPPSGRGVRTRISDDRLWLPYAAVNFIETTGDMTILDNEIPFLEGDALAEGQHESYFQPSMSSTKASLFEHCARALDCSLGTGAHGLPLMGTGDWNDGMNRVGQDGKGESVWLGWFLHTILWEFAKIADARGESKRAETWRLHVSALKAALEREAWDGGWYRRAFFDDGTPLGSAANAECRIDSIAQSWGVISGAADPGRSSRAMAAVDQQLIRKADDLILLLAPPFVNMQPDPGYIKGYVPGIRENGGQYTHAAVWTLMAFAALGDGDKAGELLRMLNPINRTKFRAGAQRYKVEPYVLAGDIYAEAPNVGRGGWTWYTGSAGWLHRAGIESVLGFRVCGQALSMNPCIPRSWPGFSIRFRYRTATYKIRVENPQGISRGVAQIQLDRRPLASAANIPLTDDGAEHDVRVVMG